MGVSHRGESRQRLIESLAQCGRRTSHLGNSCDRTGDEKVDLGRAAWVGAGVCAACSQYSGSPRWSYPISVEILVSKSNRSSFRISAEAGGGAIKGSGIFRNSPGTGRIDAQPNLNPCGSTLPKACEALFPAPFASTGRRTISCFRAKGVCWTCSFAAISPLGPSF